MLIFDDVNPQIFEACLGSGYFRLCCFRSEAGGKRRNELGAAQPGNSKQVKLNHVMKARARREPCQRQVCSTVASQAACFEPNQVLNLRTLLLAKPVWPFLRCAARCAASRQGARSASAGHRPRVMQA